MSYREHNLTVCFTSHYRIPLCTLSFDSRDEKLCLIHTSLINFPEDTLNRKIVIVIHNLTGF